MLRWLYTRRGLAKVRDKRGWRDPAYVIEYQDLEETVWKTLKRIRARDGKKIADEVAAGLIKSIRQASGL
jgi:hypothetical protein